MGRWICKGSWWVWLGLNGVLAAAVGIVVWAGAKAQDPMPGPELPTVQFSSGSYTITEGDSVTPTVTLSSASTQTVTVDYTVTVNYGGERCQLLTGTIVFSPGETSKSETVEIPDNGCCHGTVTAEVVLSNPSGAALGSPSTMTITVLDDDICP
jgi:hypothetical protein